MFKCLTEYESGFYFDRSLLRHIKSYTKYVMPDYSILSSRQSSFEIQINNCDSSVIQHQFKKLFSVLTDYHFMPTPWRLQSQCDSKTNFLFKVNDIFLKCFSSLYVWMALKFFCQSGKEVVGKVHLTHCRVTQTGVFTRK